MNEEQLTSIGTQALADALKLQSSIAGTIVSPRDDSYDASRAQWNKFIDKRPALIVQCASTDDVVKAVNFARYHGMPLSIRGGGHSAPGHGTIDDGMVIDVSGMNEVHVDPDNRVARVQGGATCKDLDEATHPHGLATTGAIVSSVGVAGMTLGGGLGWLMRSCGMTCDNLLGAEVVTAAGNVVWASESENSDLFWGLKGGGGNFGVATMLELRLHPVHTVLGGMIVHPVERAREALEFYREFMRSAPDELAVYCAMMTMPDGARVFAFLVCYSGNLDSGHVVIEPLLEWGSPVMTQVGPMPYPQMQQMLDGPNAPGQPRYFRGEIFQDLDSGLIDRMIEHFDDIKSPLSVLLVEGFGGVAGRVPPDATAFVHRDARFGLVIIAQWLEPEEASSNLAWANRAHEAIRPYANGAYVNYLGDDGAARVCEAYGPEAYQRLADLKLTYDPHNLFKTNQNVPPKSRQ